MDSIVMCCPQCEILISVKVKDCAEGREFPCPICGRTVCFKFTPEELERQVEIAKRNQERALKRSFPLTFGDV
ncbi:MAG: hypothetical protein JXA45_03595 [Methanomassiliicoccales archaeon]|nr:hypothetical protein [Methanomassiliicoccales archaeon]